MLDERVVGISERPRTMQIAVDMNRTAAKRAACIDERRCERMDEISGQIDVAADISVGVEDPVDTELLGRRKRQSLGSQMRMAVQIVDLIGHADRNPVLTLGSPLIPDLSAANPQMLFLLAASSALDVPICTFVS